MSKGEQFAAELAGQSTQLVEQTLTALYRRHPGKERAG
jgi:hypothetical protein